MPRHWIPLLAFPIIFAQTAQAHVIKDWDWHLVNKKPKRELHWCVISSPPIPNPVDAFTQEEAKKWKEWAKEAFKNWVKDAGGKPTGWSFKNVSPLDAKCQIQIRINRRTKTSSLGEAKVPTGKADNQRAEKVQIYIFERDEKGKKRKFAREGKDAVDPVRLLKHEIGHCLRLNDTKNKEDIMSSGVEQEVGNHNTKLSKEDYKEAKDAAKAPLKIKKKVSSRTSKMRYKGVGIFVPKGAFASESELAIAIRRSVFFPAPFSVAGLENDEAGVILYAFALKMEPSSPEIPLTCRLKTPKDALTGERVYSGLHQLPGVPVRDRLAAYRFDAERETWVLVESKPTRKRRTVSFLCEDSGVYGVGTVLESAR